jgi:ribonuclease M5
MTKLIAVIRMMEIIKIKEAIVVEGRDDTAAVNRAVSALTIETHGFGITAATWALIEKAYNEQGIIVFTDPDYSGEEIRRKILQKFPDSGQAFLTRKEATKDGDIGIENASPEDIIAALSKAHYTADDKTPEYVMEDLIENGLAGGSDARNRRERLGSMLGIGYGNSKSFLKKLNQFSIPREEFTQKIRELN